MSGHHLSVVPCCPLCLAEGEVLAHFPLSVTSASVLLSGSSRLLLCPVCDHLFTKVDIDLRSYYADEYDAALTAEGFDELVACTDGTTSFRTDTDYEMSRTLTGAALWPGARVFEYGCGRGRILSRLKKDGLRDLYAYDAGTAVGTVAIAAERLARGERKREAPVARASQGRARVAELLEHLRRLEATVSDLRPDSPLYLYGAGFYGTLASADLASFGIAPRGIFDANPKKHGQVRLGHAVAPLKSADESMRRDGTLFVCVNPALAGDLAATLAGELASVLVA